MAATPKKPGAKKGGVRPGAGRPAKAEAYATPIKAAEARIADQLPVLIDKLLALVEADPPDRKALFYLVDRVMGKPTQPIAGDDTHAPLRIKVEYQDPEIREV